MQPTSGGDGAHQAPQPQPHSPSTKPTPPAQPTGQAAQSGEDTRIKKGITLRVQVYVEGEDEPANDFSKSSQAFVNQVIASGLKAYTGSYTLAIQKLEALEGSDASDDG